MRSQTRSRARSRRDAVEHARDVRSPPQRRCRRKLRARARRAAVAGLRLLRSVQELRASRRRISRVSSRLSPVAMKAGAPRMRVSRTDRSLLTEWWFTVDRVLLTAVLVLIGAGAVLSLAAGPAVAIKKGLSTFYYVERHLLVAVVGLVLMLAVSLLLAAAGRGGWRWCCCSAHLRHDGGRAGVGARDQRRRRWLRIGGHSFQPSELAKPAFVVLSAWLFAESGERTDVPALPTRGGALCRARQSGRAAARHRSGIADHSRLGRTVLPFGSAIAAARSCSACSPCPRLPASMRRSRTCATRIARFLDPSSGDTYQTDRAIESFTEGGFFGRGPGEGTIKGILPDAHTDFPFAVIGEEYGTDGLPRIGRTVRLRRLSRAMAGVGGSGRLPAPRRHRARPAVRLAGRRSTWASMSVYARPRA